MKTMLKLSGESLGEHKQPFDLEQIDRYAAVIAEYAASGNRIYVVTGGGNICRGKQCKTNNPAVTVNADFIGMMGTIQNCLQIKKALMELGVASKVVVPDNFTIPQVCVHRDELTEEDSIVLLGGGIGRPGFSTDMATVTNALAFGCEQILFSKNGVEGVMTADPRKDPNAVFLPHLTYAEYIARGLEVIDMEPMKKLTAEKAGNVVSRVFLMNPENLRAMLLHDGEGLARYTTITD